MQKTPMRVLKLWSTWADDLAHDIAYREIGKPIRFYPGACERKVCFMLARGRWIRTVNGWRDAGYIASEQAGRLGNCRVQGAVLNIGSPKYRCQDPLCPQCYYRWFVKFLRGNEAWAREKDLDVIVCETPVDEDTLLTDGSRKYAIHAAREIRKAFVPACLTDQSIAAHCARLWVTVKPENGIGVARYRHQIIVVGKLLARNVDFNIRRDEWLASQPGKLSHVFGVAPSQALSPLRYCPGWLQLPYEIGRTVAEWNRNFRFKKAVVRT